MYVHLVYKIILSNSNWASFSQQFQIYSEFAWQKKQVSKAKFVVIGIDFIELKAFKTDWRFLWTMNFVIKRIFEMEEKSRFWFDRFFFLRNFFSFLIGWNLIWGGVYILTVDRQGPFEEQNVGLGIMGHVVNPALKKQYNFVVK